MAQLGGNFDASDGPTMGERDALPAGEYRAALVRSEVKDAKTAGNRYISLEFEVVDGPFQGRRFWSSLNLWNSNQQAVEIAERELRSLAQACGKLHVTDTDELHGIPMVAKLKVKSDEKYGDKSKVVSYAAMNSAPATRQAAPGGQGAATQGAAPWRKSA